MSIQRMKSSTQADIVYDYITQHIADGSIKANQKISEAEICKDLNCSRTPVREALISLSSEGILEHNMHRGFSLKPLETKEATDLYVMIGVLDGLAAKLACSHMTEEILKEMDFSTQIMDLALGNMNFDMYYKQQEIFHDYYTNICGNELLIEEIHKMKRKLVKKRYDMDSDEMTRDVLSQTNNDHKRMVEMFREKDKDALRKLLEEEHWRPAKADWESFR